MKYPHRVLKIRIQLYDEETGESLAMKTARIHETDLAAGYFMLTNKLEEIWKDVGWTLKEPA